MRPRPPASRRHRDRRAAIRRALLAACAAGGLAGAGIGDEVADSLAAPDTPPDADSAAGGDVFLVPIEGVIDLGLAPFIARTVEEAHAAGAAALVLDIDTFGGRVDAAVKIRDALIEAPIRTIAFVNPRAISAGALISLACETLAMAPGGTIGAATPVVGGGGGDMEAADEKVISYMRSEMRATAERRGRRADLAAAMVDPDEEIEGVIEKGKLLTLTTEDAVELGFPDFVASTIGEVLDQAGLAGAGVVERRANWAENIARIISHPVVSGLLMSIGFLGLMLELYQPGWGVPGTLGVSCLLLFFLGHYVVRLAGMEELLLFAAGLVLVALEVFVLPGFGVAGVLGGAAVLVSVTLALVGLDWRVSWELGLVHEALKIVSGAVLGTAGGAVLLYRLLPRGRTRHPLVLRAGLDSAAGYTSHATDVEERYPAGTRGVALSDLRPAGKIRVAGARLEAMTEGGYLDRDSQIVILEWRAGTAVVGPAGPARAAGESAPRAAAGAPERER